MPASHLDELNPQQRRAVTAPSPLLIVAGAGTGKTTTLAHRVAHLVLDGVDPQRILLLTFTRRAALTMVRRVERICAGVVLGRMMWAGTFHAVGARLLRLHAGSIGLDPAFTILDRGDAADLVDLVRGELDLARTDRRFPKKATCLAIYSYAVNAERPLEAVLREQFPWCAEWGDELRRLFGAYVEAKQAQGVLDYDDLLLWWARMMAAPELAAAIGSRFDAVLVDEYQDTNAIQAAILRGLKPNGQGVTVVGDDAQAIYAFRAATVRNILDFQAAFGAQVVTLERNYRSVQPILDAANGVIAQAREGYRKELLSDRASRQKPVLALVRDDLAQAEHVVGRVLELREAGVPLHEQAVLFRTGHHSAALELELARRNVPFVKFGGLRFLEAAHVKDLVAVLKLAENPRDRVAGFRVLQLLPGIGPAIARRILEALDDGGHAMLRGIRPPAAAAEIWPRLVTLLEHLRTAPWPAQPGLVRRFYDPLVPELYDFPDSRLADLDQLERLAATMPSRERFLTDLSLDPPETAGAEAGEPLRDEDWLILSTIHSAKGQEWKAVYVLNVVDGCIPSDMATDSPESIEEERRLLYVAMTRAKDELQLIQPERFWVTNQSRHGDRFVRARRTRFVPAPLLELFEITCPAPALAEDPAPPVTQVDIAADLRRMWR
jgi:DNA helicase II / ATP-dependent DNA helicase PcrA